MYIGQANSFEKYIGMMGCTKQFVPELPLLKRYNAIVLSHVDYCSLVWDKCSDHLIEKLQKLQNRAGRNITGKT